MPRVTRSTCMVFGVVLSLASTSCREPTAPLQVCRSIDVAVTQPAQPVFTWTPRTCGVTDIIVTSGQDFVWHVYVSANEPLIGPGITYGVPPEGARTRVQPEPLVTGRSYDVVAVWGEGDDAFLGGGATFTR